MVLEQRRKALGLTQTELAEKCGVSRISILRYETGLRTPSVTTAKRLASILGIPWTAFYNDGEEGKASEAAPHDGL